MRDLEETTPRRLKILSVWVDAVSRSEAVEQVQSMLRHGKRAQTILACNPEKNFSVTADPVLHRVFRSADLLLPDGIGMVAAAWLLHGVRLERVPGSEFIFDICRLAGAEGHRVFIYGSREGVNQVACRKLEERFPGLLIAGRSHGYVSHKDMDALIDAINAAKAAILFVALGSPRQELWMAQYAERLTTVKVCQGIGGTLDTIAGTVRRAPAFWRRHNLEWLYRLLKEPSRIKRQKVLPLFAFRVIKEWAIGKCKTSRTP